MLLNASPMTRRAFDGSDLQLNHQQQNSVNTSRSNSTVTTSSTSTSFDYPRKASAEQTSLEKKRARQAATTKERASFFKAAGTVFALK
ncbi:uncharacterized protein TRUGW13939_06918 [Talaromyces rugulosus]|uniref:Uncharacterized protein n=1 Tax=Talaromyces rugulosus TaxID=121627 RepID=A0A7H8R147_TALRU|nr:uncharacterized protein TRUGW13939_06918 [Talaromyces rugulosus]QKX59776.1 hypothetical protein TRUGW13939_06918 [Talaromyces rugulosus]